MGYIGRGQPDRVLTSADIGEGAVTLADISFTDQPANVNITGDYPKQTMRLCDNATVTGDVTIGDGLILAKLASDGDSVTLTSDGSNRTISGTGLIEANTIAQSPNQSLTGMTGELGSTITGSPALSLDNTIGTFEGTLNSNTTFSGDAGKKTAKAWVNLNGTGTVGIRDSFNVSSITDVTTGTYKVTFATPMSSSNYASAGGVLGNSTSWGSTFWLAGYNSVPQSTTEIGVNSRQVTGNAYGASIDCDSVSIIVFGD